MNTNTKLNRYISLLLAVVMILTTVPTRAYAADMSGGSDANVFKFFRMRSADGAGVPIAKSDKKDPAGKAYTNLMEGATNLELPDASVLLEFSLEFSQPVDIALYEFAGKPFEEMIFEYNEDPDIKEDFLGDKIGYIKGVRIEDNVDKSDPELYAYKRIPTEEMNRIISESRKKLDSHSIPMIDELFYGYTGRFQPMSFSQLLMQQNMNYNISDTTTGSTIEFDDFTNSTTGSSIIYQGNKINTEEEYEALLQKQLLESEKETKEYIHNIILWDGSLTDENGNDINYDYGYGVYVIVIEPVLENNRAYNSFLAFLTNDNMVTAYLSKKEHIELYKCFVEDPVDLIDGSFMWDYTDISLNGRDNLELSRHYESKYAQNDYGFGKGWTTNFTYKVEEKPLYTRVAMPNGDSIYFQMDFDGSYNASAGSVFEFEKTSYGYIMKLKLRT